MPIHPKDWTFSTNAYGRPGIANEQAGDARLSFNISHTHSLIVLGVTRGRALGVDVENFQEREALLNIADRFFAPQEVVIGWESRLQPVNSFLKAITSSLVTSPGV